MNCIVCGKPIIGKRAGAKTCSNACRSKAYYKRQTAERKWKDCNLDLFDQEDVRRIGQISFSMAESIIKVANIGGRDMARELLDGVADLLQRAKVEW